MGCLINVAVPLSGDAFHDSLAALHSLDCVYIPERKCWVGEFDADLFGDEVQVIGGFVTDNLAAMSREGVIDAIDKCADFKAVGR